MEKRIVELTDSAKEYLAKVGAPNVSLTVKGGGCSGFQYEWGTTDKEPTIIPVILTNISLLSCGIW